MIAAILASTLCACGSGTSAAGGGSPDPGDVVSTTVDPGATPGPSHPRRVEPEGGLDHPFPSAWSDPRLLRGGRAARLTWYSGVEECYGLDHVDVDYGPRTVAVTLFAGTRPEAETCIELAEQVVTVVHFDEPLGKRKLVDGSRRL